MTQISKLIFTNLSFKSLVEDSGRTFLLKISDITLVQAKKFWQFNSLDNKRIHSDNVYQRESLVIISTNSQCARNRFRFFEE